MPLKKPVNLISLGQVKTLTSDFVEPQIKPPSVEPGNNRLKSFFYKRKGQYEMTNASLTTNANLSQGKSVLWNKDYVFDKSTILYLLF